jgi:hypothetical protein
LRVPVAPRIAGDVPPARAGFDFPVSQEAEGAFGAGGNTGAGGYCSRQRDAYVTVLEGAIRSQVNDAPVMTYTAGQSFSELPGDRHNVSANASQTKPAKLLAVFVVDTNNTQLTIPLGN